jgi:hypothetical protein
VAAPFDARLQIIQAARRCFKKQVRLLPQLPDIRFADEFRTLETNSTTSQLDFFVFIRSHQRIVDLSDTPVVRWGVACADSGECCLKQQSRRRSLSAPEPKSSHRGSTLRRREETRELTSDTFSLTMSNFPLDILV